MTVSDLRALIRWADQAQDSTTFWKRLWCASYAYDIRTQVNIQAMCVNVGGLTVFWGGQKG